MASAAVQENLAPETMSEVASEAVQAEETMPEVASEAVQENLAAETMSEVPENIAEMALALPQFIVLEPVDRLDYLSYIRNDGREGDGFLKFSETHAVNPYAKFEVEFTNTNAVVHIRSCQNNKYLERIHKPSIGGYWIAATANNKEDDRTKPSSTLFRFISVNPAANTVRIQHVQSQRYLCMWVWGNPTFNRCVKADYSNHDGNSRDIFKMIDWSSLLILPRYLALKGDNNMYLKRVYNKKREHLQFVTGDVAEEHVACEVFPTSDGNIRIKQISNGRFWKFSPNWIFAESTDTSTNDRATLFRPVKVNDDTIALINLGNNKFCKRFNYDGINSGLAAVANTIEVYARLKVEEPVLTREIYGVRYDVDNARIYNEAPIVVKTQTAVNNTNVPSRMTLKFVFEESEEITWRVSFSLKLKVKATASMGIPIIFGGRVVISGQVQSGVEWEKNYRKTIRLEDEYEVVVPPKTRARVNMIATRGNCDVHFTYMQNDTLYDGTNLPPIEVHGGFFKGADYYNTRFEEFNEPLP